MADCLQELFDLSEETCLRVSAVDPRRLMILTVMVDRDGQFDGSKVARAFEHVLLAGGTLEVAIDGSKMRVVETFLSRSKTRFILRITM
jgi:hypothetical protein